MTSKAENRVRIRLANNGRNVDNDNRGVPVGSDLHMCEMLLGEIVEMRQALIEICRMRDVNTPEGAWRSDLQQIARAALERNEQR